MQSQQTKETSPGGLATLQYVFLIKAWNATLRGLMKKVIIKRRYYQDYLDGLKRPGYEDIEMTREEVRDLVLSLSNTLNQAERAVVELPQRRDKDASNTSDSM